MCCFLKEMNPDSCLLGQGFSSVALKVQAVEGGVPLKGLPNQTWSGSSWNGLIALLSSLVNE